MRNLGHAPHWISQIKVSKGFKLKHKLLFKWRAHASLQLLFRRSRNIILPCKRPTTKYIKEPSYRNGMLFIFYLQVVADSYYTRSFQHWHYHVDFPLLPAIVSMHYSSAENMICHRIWCFPRTPCFQRVQAESSFPTTISDYYGEAVQIARKEDVMQIFELLIIWKDN